MWSVYNAVQGGSNFHACGQNPSVHLVLFHTLQKSFRLFRSELIPDFKKHLPDGTALDQCLL